MNDTYMFWSNAGEHVIGRANIDGSHVWQRCISTQTQPLETVAEGIAVDAQHVYWTTYPADTIVQANLEGTDIQRLVALQGVPGGIALDTEPGSGISSVGRRVNPLLRPFCSARRPSLLAPTPKDGVRLPPLWSPTVVPRLAELDIDEHWGGKIASGRGLNPTYGPHGGYYRQPVLAQLQASDIRRCVPGGRLVYTRFIVREQVRPGGPMGKWFAWNPNMCRGI